MRKFRKKPVVIEAIQITMDTFKYDHPHPDHVRGVVYDPVNLCVYVKTLEGEMQGNLTDWIIRGVKGELYPCKDEIFRATYDEVPE